MAFLVEFQNQEPCPLDPRCITFHLTPRNEYFKDKYTSGSPSLYQNPGSVWANYSQPTASVRPKA